MDLETQIQSLIDNAPRDGMTPQIVSSIAPALRAIAQKLNHPQYYILQNSQENWVLTTVSKRANPKQQKRVIFAYPTLQDVSLSSPAGLDPQMVAKPLPVIQILFQLVALEPVDSIVFWETPGTTNHTVEVPRQELESLIQQELRRHQSSQKLPPDIA
ncbi:MAG TPA: hypothetical protein VK203_21585 [Nostocaceae cyanobacterium]|nr:hypothetical protein [Nostocaceae cyanobacterium]